VSTYAAVPELLKTTPNWVTWKDEVRDGKHTKVPYDAKSNGNHTKAKSNDQTTWTTFSEAVKAADILSGSDYDGVGFMLHGDLVGIDFDGALHDGVAEPYVTAILKLLGNPYCEVSPSGNGLHAFVQCAALPPGQRKFSNGNHSGAEIYSESRYFTVTGNHFSGSGVPKIDDISTVYFLVSQIRNDKFKKLWTGDIAEYGDDQSRADLALMDILAMMFNHDPQEVGRVFSKSALGQRDKWTGREDYRDRTIAKACGSKDESEPVGPEGPWEPHDSPRAKATLTFHSAPAPESGEEYVLDPLPGRDDGWFPVGDISLVGGKSGSGKTTVLFDLLHKQKQGYPFLGHLSHQFMFCVLAYDRKSKAFLRTIRRMRLLPTDIPVTSFPLAYGVNAVQNVIDEIEKMNPTPRIVLIEALDMLLDDANKKSIVAPFMRQLQDVAEHFQVALIGTVGAPKLRKGEDYAATRDNLSGSEAWGRNCETVAVLMLDEKDDTAPLRELTVLPRNASAERFSLQFANGCLVLAPPKSEEEKQRKMGRPSEAEEQAERFLTRELREHPEGVADLTLIKNAKAEADISRQAMYRAADKLGIDRRHAEKVQVRNDRGQMRDALLWKLTPIFAGTAEGEESHESTF